MLVLQKIKRILNMDNKVAIISHTNPDGDALGSQIALSLGLNKRGYKTVLINKDLVPESFDFLPGKERIKPLKQSLPLPKIIIFVDCATLERSGYEQELSDKSDRFYINIDHHISNNRFADLNWIEEKAAATAEMIYQLLDYLHVEIDQDIATALYTGISTDTGSFLYENTTATTHKIAAELLMKGAHTNQLRSSFYENISKGRLKLLKTGLNNLFFALDDQISWMSLSYQELLKSGAIDDDGDGLINYVKNISGVEVALVFREIEPNKIKISLRSKNWFDVNQIALYFQGGGHARAAGCVLEGNLKMVIDKVLDHLQKDFQRGGPNLG